MFVTKFPYKPKDCLNDLYSDMELGYRLQELPI